MFEIIRNHQLNIMLCLCAACATMTILLLFTKYLSKRRKWILVSLEVTAAFLLFFDRLAYIYSGVQGSTGYIMVRVSNFMVFFLTSAVVFMFNNYLVDLLKNEGRQVTIPRRLNFTSLVSAVGMLFVIISAFTGFYYYFDSSNMYHRGPGFLFCYVVPVFCPLIQYTVIVKYRKCFSHFIYIALTLYIFAPIVTGIIQIFAYGISIVNMAMVLVSIFLYFFNYLDVNEALEKAYKIKIQAVRTEQKNLKIIFDQAVAAFSKLQNNNGEVAETAREIARMACKSEKVCSEVYYAAMLYPAGYDVLSCIKEYPYLSETAAFIGKNCDETMPEYARIINVAKDYVSMINDASIPAFYLRDYLIRESGRKYDSNFAMLAVKLLDKGTLSGKFDNSDKKMESELICAEYREQISSGIEISHFVTEITFDCSPFIPQENKNAFSSPSIILFDSSDGYVQITQETIDSHKYLEYGEIWFDSHVISSNVRNMEVRNVIENSENDLSLENDNAYCCKISACRFGDHILLKMQGAQKSFDVIIALQSESKSAYIGITGENIYIKNIEVKTKQQEISDNDIPRIAEKINYIERIESDIPNVQIVKPLCAFTKGIRVNDNMKVYLHTQSLPDANLVWHCPYIILYSSDDGQMYGQNYHEYALIKFDGEDNGSNEYAENNFLMNKTETFSDWEEWENQNRNGYECQIDFIRKGNEVTVKTHNKGIFIQNTTTVKDGRRDVYVALSGDQVVLTDIIIR